MCVCVRERERVDHKDQLEATTLTCKTLSLISSFVFSTSLPSSPNMATVFALTAGLS